MLQKFRLDQRIALIFQLGCYELQKYFLLVDVITKKHGKTTKYEESTWWKPTQSVLDARQRQLNKSMSKSQSWDVNFRQFRAYADMVVDYLRKKGFNAQLILREIRKGFQSQGRHFVIFFLGLSNFFEKWEECVVCIRVLKRILY